jgi:hypothetical protein
MELNESSHYWRSEIEVNVFPADSMNKRPTALGAINEVNGHRLLEIGTHLTDPLGMWRGELLKAESICEGLLSKRKPRAICSGLYLKEAGEAYVEGLK